jgi:hypothetical protein
MLGGAIHRCHNCNSRYVLFGGSLVRLASLRRISLRLLLGLVMVVAGGVVIATILWVSRPQAAPAGDTGRLTPHEVLLCTRGIPNEPGPIFEQRNSQGTPGIPW